jgi:hypothetical protein
MINSYEIVSDEELNAFIIGSMGVLSGEHTDSGEAAYAQSELRKFISAVLR